MSGSPGRLRAVPSVGAASSIGAASGPREASRGGGQRHSRIPYCSSGLQAGCGRTSQCSTRHTDIQQQASAAQRVPGPARHLGALAVTLPTGCLQPVGLAPALVARGPACCSATSKSGHLRIAGTGHLRIALTTSSPPSLPKLRSKPACATCVDELRHPQRSNTARRLQVFGTGPWVHLQIAFVYSRVSVTPRDPDSLTRHDVIPP